MFGLVMSQWSLWTIFGLGLLVIMVANVNRDRPNWALASLLAAAFTTCLFTTYYLGICYGVHADDFCIVNGHVTSARFEEHWTETYTTVETHTDGKGHTTTRVVTHVVDHPDSWAVHTTVGHVAISGSYYWSVASRFHANRQIPWHHGNQSSWGDGRVFEAKWDGNPATIIPWSDSISVINWIKASRQSVYHSTSLQAGIQVPVYPSLTSVGGRIKLPRVLGDVVIPADWKAPMEWNMDVLADQVGVSRQCNPILLLTRQGPQFTESIQAGWLGGKKNDAIIILGVTEWPTVEWVKVVSWSKDTMLEPQLRDQLEGTSLMDTTGLMQALHDGLTQHFDRTRMHDFEYLKGDIRIPAWIPLVCLGFVFLAGMITYFANTDPWSY